MSVYKPRASPFYHYDFQIRLTRFCGSTGCTSRREAEGVERAEKEKARALLKRGSANTVNLTISEAASRYWVEVGQHHACASETFVNLERLVDYFGNVTKLVAWRCGHRRWGRKNATLISPATVNRSTTEVLQKLFTGAKRKWGGRFDNEPNWREHMLPEEEEHVRELRADEADKLTLATRHDYAPFFAFARATGLRLRECLLKWSEVDWGTRLITKRGKGGRTVTAPITVEVEAILAPLVGNNDVWVFTYVAARSRGKRVKGKRYQITYSGAKTQWRRLRARAKVTGFRFHDFRHDLGTKLLRATGNLKLVQRALNHANIKTTTRYAHVLDEEVTEALESVQSSRKAGRIASREAS
jgi:integrase